MVDSKIHVDEMANIINDAIASYNLKKQQVHQGTIVSLQDGIVQIYGLDNVVSGEMLDFGNDIYGVALNLDENITGAVVLGTSNSLREGDSVKATQQVLNVPVGEELLGRVVNALGQPIDGMGAIKAKAYEPVEKIAPGVIFRQSVDQPLQTGIKAIDTMTPIGRGQRELIIGDRQTGKTSIAIDTIINQKGTGIKCIYVAIGQKASSIAVLVQKLKDHGAMEYTTIINASASDTAALQYIAPYSGCTMGEYYRDKGEDALIIYDDLSKHAAAYRQISLLLRRPPGREAYPGDIFYLHSRLLERAARVNTEYVSNHTQGKVTDKTGSLTALPIVETQAGDVSAFVPTNVISITDGQIFLDTSLFNSGVRPAVNSGLSVSRVGGAAQTPIIKKLGSSVRISLAQFRELEAFSQFSSDLDESTRKQLDQGKKVMELMKQPAYAPLSMQVMACVLLLAESKAIQSIEPENIAKTCNKLIQYLEKNAQDLLNSIQTTPKLTEELKAAFDSKLDYFMKNVV